MNDQIEDLIRLIATRHGIAVSRDDPIFVLQTINDRLMQDSLKAQQIQLDRYKQEMEGIALRWAEDSKGKAERMLNAALAGSKVAVTQLMDDGAKAAAETVREEIDASIARLTMQIRDSVRIGMLNVVASCITLLAAALVIFVSLR